MLARPHQLPLSWTQGHAGPSRLIRHFATTTPRSARTHGSHSHYEALTLPQNATKQQIKARFYELSKKHHPDAKGGDTSKFHEINDAYAILGDESKRRSYDLSLVPASQARRPHAPSHSSFSPNDPYLARNARGPHQAWRGNHPPPHQHARSHPSQADYTPFGRKTPPNFQYEYTYNFDTSPNARRERDTSRPKPRSRAGDGEEEGEGEGEAGGGIWKFVVTVGMILTVISLGGGLTANSQSPEEWAARSRRGDERESRESRRKTENSIEHVVYM